ncbi:L-type lectin-domain containing receptor kinase IX.1 [Andrographis paniculata]|uniref:L-type lectin-domain containing receptor kinase IX.1 n=1 Tax=Andrographis paniculata TaxID=175694 RepID=UPI0021E6F4FA|nr:L-type lectin-domain containing receptor kinase IX.1 [Andrographis paniculata]
MQAMISTVLIVLIFFPFSHSVNFQVQKFGPDVSAVVLEGDAENSAGEVQITNIDWNCRVGRVIHNRKIPLWDTNSGQLTDFTSRFSFRIDLQNRTEYGNGFTFFLAPPGYQIPPNSAGGFLGLFNTTTTDLPETQIVHVEFDTFSNDWDPKYQHVGINTNSITSAVTAPWNVSLHSGEIGTAWIVYNAAVQNLTVFWSYGGRPNSSLSYSLDLKKILPQWVIVGISAATGRTLEINALVAWEFASGLDIPEDNGSHNKNRTIGYSVGFSLLACILIAAAGFLLSRKRKKNRESKDETTNLTSINNDLEQGAGPRRFSYKDIALATNNFSADKKLGQGGFGAVYKGHLTGMDIPVAVKKFSGGSKQGKKQYITEVKIISMLRHRNLVQLIGWCHDRGEFLLVYEFMPNRSLDYHLFGRTRSPLSWNQRYKIALGLASALLYLHEEWDQCVLHRDIKSSNLMLDSSYNVKLGDFGLARLMDHELGPQTTGLAGTLGYLAPEYVTTGRASKESDVYSFGVVVLEIVTGRRSVDPLDKATGKGLVEWVWDLYGAGEALGGVDGKIGADIDRWQAECLTVVGLWCAHPDRSLRPPIRMAAHVLNFEAELPKLPAQMPVAMYYAASNPSVSSGEALVTDSSMNVGR